jgi:galactoside O-acetyltransferase
MRNLFSNIKAYICWAIKKAELKTRYNCVIEHGAFIKFPDNLRLGRNVKIGSGAFIHCGENQLSHNAGNVAIRDNAYIGPNSVLLGEGGIEVGTNCEVAPGVVITSQQHTYGRLDIPIKEQPAEMGKVTLEDDVWLGCNSSILPGVRIGKGSIVGAGAVVTKDIPPYSVAVGVPAKVIKKRG